MSEALEKRVEELQEQLARVEVLLRAVLKRAPARHQVKPPKKAAGEGLLSDEQKAEIRARMRRKR